MAPGCGGQFFTNALAQGSGSEVILADILGSNEFLSKLSVEFSLLMARTFALPGRPDHWILGVKQPDDSTLRFPHWWGALGIVYVNSQTLADLIAGKFPATSKAERWPSASGSSCARSGAAAGPGSGPGPKRC
jgi:hypothetical protein